jgi:TDG/mug DNA glycosylase family protein
MIDDRKPAPPFKPVPPFKPTPAECLAAADRVLPDVIGSGLDVLFCGINPGLYSAATGHHFARPGNRFWPALHAGGFTPRRFWPWEQDQLPPLRLGITNLVARASAAAAELTPVELTEGGMLLRAKAERYRPAVIAFLGVTAYRAAFGRPRAALGRQPEPIGPAIAWVLPNPSGLNAHHRPADLARLFGDLRRGGFPTP